MSNELVAIEESQFNALKSSIYPGAKDESIHMLLSYCKALKIDPMLKTHHIVPMSVKDAKTQKYEFRDVVMPGIGFYRIQADRSGRYAGISQAEFGPKINDTIDGCIISYPEWCEVKVKKIVGHVLDNPQICEFSSGKKYWKENYATKNKDTTAPNSMWYKRPYEQLEKCAEAQALRRAFPEILGSLHTAEEMEGKSITIEGDQYVEVREKKKETGDALKAKLLAKGEFIQNITATPELVVAKSQSCIAVDDNVSSGITVWNGLSDETYRELCSLMAKLIIDDKQKSAWLTKAKVNSLLELSEEQATKIIEMLLKKMQ